VTLHRKQKRAKGMDVIKRSVKCSGYLKDGKLGGGEDKVAIDEVTK